METTKDDKGGPIVIEYNSDKQKIKVSSFYQNGQISNTEKYNPKTGHKTKGTIYNLDGSIYHSYVDSEELYYQWLQKKQEDEAKEKAEAEKAEKEEKERKRIVKEKWEQDNNKNSAKKEERDKIWNLYIMRLRTIDGN